MVGASISGKRHLNKAPNWTAESRGSEISAVIPLGDRCPI